MLSTYSNNQIILLNYMNKMISKKFLKLCKEIEIIYMVVGHTKFSCDRILGHAKNAYYRAKKIIGID